MLFILIAGAALSAVVVATRCGVVNQYVFPAASDRARRR